MTLHNSGLPTNGGLQRQTARPLRSSQCALVPQQKPLALHGCCVVLARVMAVNAELLNGVSGGLVVAGEKGGGVVYSLVGDAFV